MGFALPASVTGAAVRSYRTFSPLPGRDVTPNQAVLFSVALSVKFTLCESSRPLAGMLLYGDRTFLPPLAFRLGTGDRPSGRSNIHIARNRGSVSCIYKSISSKGEIRRKHLMLS